jgi:hypothetical protein
MQSEIKIHGQNVEVNNADGKKCRRKKVERKKRRLGQNVEWKKRRLGQNIEDKKTSTWTKRRKVKKRRPEKT